MHVPTRGALALAAALAVSIVLASAGCSTTDSPADQPSGPAPTGSGPAGQSAAAFDPCALVTAADVKTAFGQTVSDTERYETITDETGTTERCALSTNGKPVAGAGFDALSELASGFTGRALTSQPTASVGVILVTRADPYDAAAGDLEKLPPGSKTIPGLGSFALVLGVTTGGGIAFAQTSPTTMVIVYDLEDRTVPAADMETLLRAAVPRA